MNIPLQATKKRRCLNFDVDTSAVHYVDDLSPEEEERKAITKLQLWKVAGFDRAPPKYENADALEALSLDVVAALESSKATRTNRQLATENVFKTVEEFNQLISLTSHLNAKEFVGIVGCFREKLQKRGIPIPPVQAVQILCDRYEAAERSLDKGIVSARPAVLRRRKFAEGLLDLRQFWGVGTREEIFKASVPKWGSDQGPVASMLPPLSREQKNEVVVDCSFVRAGDGVGSLVDYLVPLSVGDDGPSLVDSETTRTMKTIQFSAICRSTGKLIARTTAWNAVEAVLAAAAGPSTDALKIVHRHLQMRQHEAMSQRLFT